MVLQPETDVNLFFISEEDAKQYASLPQSLSDALALTQKSKFVADIILAVLSKYIVQKEQELACLEKADRQKVEHDLYFHRI